MGYLAQNDEERGLYFGLSLVGLVASFLSKTKLPKLLIKPGFEEHFRVLLAPTTLFVEFSLCFPEYTSAFGLISPDVIKTLDSEQAAMVNVLCYKILFGILANTLLIIIGYIGGVVMQQASDVACHLALALTYGRFRLFTGRESFDTIMFLHGAVALSHTINFGKCMTKQMEAKKAQEVADKKDN